MERNRRETEPCYVISVAARMLNMQTHTLRYYEKIGIIEPHRSRGNIRLYSERDIAMVRRVKSFTEDMGVNLAGVEVILRMLGNISQLQGELEQMREELKKLKEETGQ
ncbi:MAG: MerR family transcriptional regulator [Dehalococcoidales bacterium]|nr:MerR family transcriptional regulator [Dehalococcoidales bacterium]